VNEHEKGRRIARYLDDSLDALDPSIVRRLETALSRALAALPDREAAAELALAGAAPGRSGPAATPSWAGTFRVLLPAAALLVAMVGTYVWQELNSRPDEAEMDLLADELPIDAYLDKGFQQWISASLEQ
jgi:hypothetical protein